MHEPAFWRGEAGVAARLLDPLGRVYAAATAARLRRLGWRAPVPVVCCGAATAGGAGKTPLALELGARVQARGRRPAFLTRGHGGRLRRAFPVDAGRHDAAAVGDEALLLARVAPTFVAADRAAAARAAIAAGADLLVMDDGLQNPDLADRLGLLVIDGLGGFGNGRIVPGGPLREPVAAASARCRAAVLVGEDCTGALDRLPPALPVLRARLSPHCAVPLAGVSVHAFAGIGRPEKFFESARHAGAHVLQAVAFPDHHRFGAAELSALASAADAARARLLTTAKDAVRLPPAWRARVLVLQVTLVWEDEREIDALLASL